MVNDKEVLAQIELGIDVENFLKTNIGKYLASRAYDELAEALNSLKNVDYNDSEAIRKLQNQAWLAEQFIIWLQQAVHEGKTAEEVLRQTDYSD